MAKLFKTEEILTGKKHIQSFTKHDVHFDNINGRTITVLGGYKAPKNITTVTDSELETLRKSHVFKELDRNGSINYLDSIPDSFIDPVEAIGEERAKAAEAINEAGKSKTAENKAIAELEEYKRKAHEQGIVI